MRREWVEMLARPFVVELRVSFMSLRVKYLPLWKAKSGPCPDGCRDRNVCKARMGHSIVLLAATRTQTPSRKGSVLDALMQILAWSALMSMSRNKRVVSGSNCVLWEEVYSETRKKPKKANRMAAHNIVLSSYNLVELKRLWAMVCRRVGVMGRRLGTDREDPCFRLIPLVRRYNRLNEPKGVECPRMMLKCLMAAMCNFTLAWELWDAR